MNESQFEIRKVITQKPASPMNYRPRRFRPGTALPWPVLAVIIHVMDGSLAGTDAWFANPAARVSAHYGIGGDGTIHQYVPEADAAWHAGIVKPVVPPCKLVAEHPGVNPNDMTVGIEHEGHANTVWPLAMVQASAELVADICKRHGIPIDRDHILRHNEVSADHAACPGLAPMDRIVELARGF